MTHVQKETAVLLKEKGFDLPCRKYFIANKEEVQNTHDNFPINWNKHDDIFSAPTLHEAADWLREAKGVHVAALPQYQAKKWIYRVYQVSEKSESFHQLERDMVNFDTYDLALEAGIIHALKHYVK